MAFSYFRAMKVQNSKFKLSLDDYINGQQHAIHLQHALDEKGDVLLVFHCTKFDSISSYALSAAAGYNLQICVFFLNVIYGEILSQDKKLF